MGSTSALTYNLHLSSTHCFKCRHSNPNQRPSLHIHQRRTKIGLSIKRDYRKFSRFVCSAVEDLTEKGGIGSVVEDRTGKKDEPPNLKFLCIGNFYFFLLIWIGFFLIGYVWAVIGSIYVLLVLFCFFLFDYFMSSLGVDGLPFSWLIVSK